MKVLTAKRETLEAIKPFQLVKYLALSSLMVILVSTVLISGFISQRAKAILLQKSEQYVLLVAENLNHQVFFQFTLPTLITEGKSGSAAKPSTNGSTASSGTPFTVFPSSR